MIDDGPRVVLTSVEAIEHIESPVPLTLSTGSGDNLTAQVVLFGWRHEAGVSAAAKRLKERDEERKRAAAPKERLVVEEGDVDMFS